MKKWFRNNGLSIAFITLFFLSLIGQAITGLKQHNEETLEMGGHTVTMSDYLTSGHFLQATFENWESEFLQMALFLILSIFLYQKGSSESKDPDKKEEVDREPDPRRNNVPWPVKKGGFILAIYKHSLCYALSFLFIISFLLHWYGSFKDYNEEQILKGKQTETASEYLSNSRFWFESFQNWESEFLSIFSLYSSQFFYANRVRHNPNPLMLPIAKPEVNECGAQKNAKIHFDTFMISGKTIVSGPCLSN